MKQSKNKKIIKAAVAFVVVLALVIPGSAAFANMDIAKLEELGPEENIVELSGSVGVELFGQHAIVVPVINMSESQVLKFNVSKTGNGTYLVNETLRINVDVPENISGQRLLGRHLTVGVVMYRDMPLISGLMRQLFIGKPLTVKRINVFSDDEKYVDIPINYETTKESERIIIHIFAIGAVLGKLRDAECPPLIAYKRISTEFQYSAQWYDVTAPVTTCTLAGEMINGTFIGEVTVTLTANDHGVGIRDTNYSISYTPPGGPSSQTSWIKYTEPFPISDVGDYAIFYYSADHAGNKEEVKNTSFPLA